MNSLPPETTNPDNPDDPGDDNGGGEEETVVTFESLGIQPEYFASLARANKSKSNGSVKEYRTIGIEIDENDNIIDSFIYEGNKFIPVTYDDEGEHELAEIHIRYKDGINAIYYVPIILESKFDQAKANFNNVQ